MKCLSMQKFWEEYVGETDTVDTRGIYLSLGSPEAKRWCDSTNIIKKKKKYQQVLFRLLKIPFVC